MLKLDFKTINKIECRDCTKTNSDFLFCTVVVLYSCVPLQGVSNSAQFNQRLTNFLWFNATICKELETIIPRQKLLSVLYILLSPPVMFCYRLDIKQSTILFDSLF